MDRTIILDSGAFSAWSRGEAIDIDAYIAFIFANAEFIDYYVNLDVIPGSFGVMPTPAQVEESAQASWDNLLYMESQGLKPMPVFHMGESFKWLHRMMEHAVKEGGCDYVGISPANDRPTRQKQLWLDRVFTEIGDADGRPRLRAHGLGVTAIPLLVRYPWYSCDSSSWVMQGARGCVLVPKFSAGRFNYDTSPMVIYMSGVKSAQDEDATDYRTIAPNVRKHVDDYIEVAGSTIELCKVDCKERSRVCGHFFLEFAKHGTKVEAFRPHRTNLWENR